MNLSNSLLYLSAICFIIAILSSIYFGFFSKLFKNSLSNIKSTLDFSQFIQNLLFPLFSIGGALIIYSTIITNNYQDNLKHYESIYFKLLQYHRENNFEMVVRHSPKAGKEIKGKAAFTNFDSQLRKAIKIIQTVNPKLKNDITSNIAFQIFFIGTNDSSERAILDKNFKKYQSLIKLDSVYILCNRIKHDSTVNAYFDGNKTKLSSFFNQFFATLEYLDKQDILNESDKFFYADLLLIQNGLYEKSIIYFYSKSDLCIPKHKYLADKYIVLSDNEIINNIYMFKSRISID